MVEDALVKPVAEAGRPTDVAAVDDLPREHGGRRLDVIERHHCLHATLARCGSHRLGLVEMYREGLFAIDVLPGVNRRQRHLPVEEVWGGDVDDVEAGISN